MVRNRFAVLAILGTLVFSTGPLYTSSPQTPQKIPPRTGCPASGGRPVLLIEGSLECVLASQEEHIYRVPLRAGDFLSVVIDQRGIDTGLTFTSPSGEVILFMNSPNGRRGEEPVKAVAKVSGEHLLTVKGGRQSWRGYYRVTLDRPRAATADNRLSAAAFRTISEGDDLKRAGKNKAAAAAYRNALGVWRSLGDGWGQVFALERLGDLLERNEGDRGDALRTYRLALSQARSFADQSAEARISIRLGNLLFKRGDLTEAFELAQRVLRLAESSDALEAQAYAYNLIAVILKAKGEVDEALRWYSRSQSLLHSLREPWQESVIVTNRGEFLLAIGQSEEALGEFEQALRLLDQEDAPEQRAAVLNGAGLAYTILGKYSRALWAFRLALRLTSKPEYRAFILSRAGLVLLETNRLDQAARSFKETIQLARQTGDRRREAFAMADLAGVEDLQGKDRDALMRLDEAYAILKEIGDPAAMASVLFGRASAARDLDQLEKALSSIERSIEIIESLRAQMKDSEMRVDFFASRHRYYDRYIDLLMELYRKRPGKGYGVQAFNISEQSRARSLLDDVTGSPSVAAMPLATIQRELLDNSSVLLSYSLGERESFLWVVTPGSIKAFNLPSRKEIEESVLRARGQLIAGDFGKEVASLSARLLPSEIKAQKLLIVPDGVLHLVPFGALCNPGLPQDCQRRTYRPLVFDHEISLLPSASLILGMRKTLLRRPLAPRLLAIFSSPVFARDDVRLRRKIGEARKDDVADDRPGSGLKSLPYTYKEGLRLLELAPPNASTRHVYGFEATSEAAKSPDLAMYQIIHFATHNLTEGHPDFTGLVLSRFDSEGKSIDGLLRAREIYGLSFPAELVVLSACGTGLDRQVQGEGPMGLSRAFLHAGAKRIVVSLWDVAEGATAELMSRFYKGLLQEHLSPAAALRAAQISMARESKWRSPRHWAAFVLQGEPF